MDASYGALIVVLVVSVLLLAWLVWRLRRDEFPGGKFWLDHFVERRKPC